MNVTETETETGSAEQVTSVPTVANSLRAPEGLQKQKTRVWEKYLRTSRDWGKLRFAHKCYGFVGLGIEEYSESRV